MATPSKGLQKRIVWTQPIINLVRKMREEGAPNKLIVREVKARYLRPDQDISTQALSNYVCTHPDIFPRKDKT